MPGFRGCSWCHGKGCMCCDTEKAKWEATEAARIEREAKEDPRDKLARLTSPLTRLILTQLRDTRALAALDAEIAAAEAACDAEYKRQFPNGPEPIFTADMSNPDDVEAMKTAFHRDVLEKVYANGVTPEATAEILRLAEQARLAQATRKALCPNEQDGLAFCPAGDTA